MCRVVGYFDDERIIFRHMKAEQISERVKVGAVVSFKVPNQDFADLFNAAMSATGAKKAPLATEAVLRGLQAAVWSMTEGREIHLKRFQTLAIKRLNSAGSQARVEKAAVKVVRSEKSADCEKQ